MEKRAVVGVVGSVMSTTGMALVVAGAVNDNPWLWTPGALAASTGIVVLLGLYMTAKAAAKPVEVAATSNGYTGIVDRGTGTLISGNTVLIEGEGEGIRLEGVGGKAFDNKVAGRPSPPRQ